MSAYWDVLEAVERTVVADERFRDVRVTVRKRPTLKPLVDRFPQLVVAPREDLTESVVGRQSESMWVGYDVYLGLFTDARDDVEILQRRLDYRQFLRELFQRPKSLQQKVNNVWNTEYDPRPAVGFGPDTPAPNVDYSWQRFTFVDYRTKGFTFM